MSATDELIEPMVSAVQYVAAGLMDAAVPAPAATWDEFATAFDAIDGTATQRLRGQLDAAMPGIAWFGDAVPDAGEGWFADVTGRRSPIPSGLAPLVCHLVVHS